MKTKGYAAALLSLSLFTSLSYANECPSVLKFMKRKLNSQETVNLCDEYAGKTLLVVNTASYCGQFSSHPVSLQPLLSYLLCRTPLWGS